MESLRKVKKLLKRYPLIFEIRVPSMTTQATMENVRKSMRERFGDNMIAFIVPDPEEMPQAILQPVQFSEQELTKFREEWQELMNSGKAYEGESKMVIGTDFARGKDQSVLTVYDPSRIRIHSVLKMSSKQHQEILQAIKEAKVKF